MRLFEKLSPSDKQLITKHINSLFHSRFQARQLKDVFQGNIESPPISQFELKNLIKFMEENQPHLRRSLQTEELSSNILKYVGATQANPLFRVGTKVSRATGSTIKQIQQISNITNSISVIKELRQYKSLKKLDLNANEYTRRLSGQYVVELCEALEELKNLRYLDLGYNYIGDEGAIALSQVIGQGHLRNLQTLGLSTNKISDVGMNELCSVIS